MSRLGVLGCYLLLAGCLPDVGRFEIDAEGAIIRGSTEKRDLAVVFTGDEYADGAEHIISVLKSKNLSASFFFTGKFYRNPDFAEAIVALRDDGHYLGAHSDRHLLYCSWEKRDSLLVTREEFEKDLRDNYAEMERFGVQWEDAPLFLPPYEWYNRQIVEWTSEMGLTLVNYTPGTKSHADYTTVDMGERYVPSGMIFFSIREYEAKDPNGLNGFILLMHIGTAPEREDKLYRRLDGFFDELLEKGYTFKRIDEMLGYEGTK